MAKVIHIRDVPDDVHAALTEAAEARGLSLTKYLRQQLEEVARADFLVQHNLAVIREVQSTMPRAMDPDLTLELLREGRGE